MICGAQLILYSKDADADRSLFPDVLGFRSVDAGHGWLIFGMPAAEAAFHPDAKNTGQELYFMCNDLRAEMADLAKKGRAFPGCKTSPLGFDHKTPVAGRR